MRLTVGEIERLLDPGLTYVIGRRSPADVVIDHDGIEPAHAEIRVLDGRWIIEDLISGRSGTFAHGRGIEWLIVDSPLDLTLGSPDDGVAVRLEPLGEIGGPAQFADQVDAADDDDDDSEAIPHLERPLRVHTLRGEVVGIGRADDNGISLNDLEASLHHAHIRRSGDQLTIADLDSFNGTFVNGDRITTADLDDGDFIEIGSRILRLVDGQIEEHSSADHFPIAALGLSVITADGTVLLDDVSLAVGESTMMAVLGPSGSGKSTLIGALTGLRPATRGTVYCGGLDLYTHFESLRRRIAYVPQDDLVQPELTVGQSLRFAARLRFAPDVSDAERDRRVAEVMDDLGLTHRSDVRVGDLSGGQRKRVSVALELLTEPSVLVLDEPTSGLDPGYERSVMQLLRRLADGGRTVIVVTHSTESLHLCDRLLCLTPGGKLAWFGPPARTPAYFDKPSFQEIFQVLDAGGAGADTAGAVAPDELKAKFRDHAAYERFVAHPLEAYDPDPDHEVDVSVAPMGRWFSQFWTLTRRYARIVASDRRTLFILLATAPILGLVLMIRLPPDQLVRPDGSPVPLFSQAPVVLFIVVMALTQVGISTAAREIVKEREIFIREKTVGLSVSAYVMSKVAVLGVLAVAQAVIVVLIGTARQGRPLPGVLLSSGRLELVLAGTLTILAAMALGLLVSAAAKNADHVALVLPAVIGFHMLVSSGEIFPASDDVPVLEQAKVLSSARWGFAAMSASADTERLTLVNQAIDTFGELELDPAELEALARQIDDLDELDALVSPDSAFTHEVSTFALDLGVLGLMVVVMVAGTTLVLRRSEDL